jgi:hypothetical protein
MLSALITASAAFAAQPITEAELSNMRGGFSLPGGLEATMAVRTETSVDGGLLLRSVYLVDRGAPSLQLFAPRTGEAVRGQSAATASPDRALQGSVRINFDRQNGVSISRQMAMPAASVTVGASAPKPTSDSLQALDLSDGPVDTPGGRVSVSQSDTGVRSRLEGDGIDATHLFGNAFGAVVANTANNRVIDSSTTITLDLRGATPLNLGSAMLRAEAVAADAVRQLVVR